MKPPIIRQSPLSNNWYLSRNYEEVRDAKGKVTGYQLKGKKIDVTDQVNAIIAMVLADVRKNEKNVLHRPGCADPYCGQCVK